MATQILFVQGGGGKGVHDEWDNKLVDGLQRELGADYAIRYPRMPHESDPTYADWRAALGRQFAWLADGAILVGHSVGATILLRTLADDPPELKFGGLFLIAAPFVGDGGWPSEGMDMPPLSDVGGRLPRGTPIYFYHGDRDDTAPVGHLALYARAIPQAVVRRLPDRDHQLNNDMSEVAADIRVGSRASGAAP